MESDSEEASRSLESIIKSRLQEISKRISQYATEAERFCREGSDDNDSIQKAQICASKLENIIKRFSSELNEYFRISNHPSADEISDMSTIQLNGEEMLVELKCTLDKKKNNTGENRNFSAKLPVLSLPEFEGDVLAWSEFWDIYKSNIHDRAISDVDKLLYLKSTLKGEPRKIIDGLETTNRNYSIAIQILKDRYGKQSHIVDAHYRALSKVKTADKSISECRTVLNEVERHLRVLQSLGEDISSNHLRYLIIEKFPEDVIYEMKIKMKEDTVTEMRKQLEIIVAAREEAQRFSQEKSFNEKEKYIMENLHTIHNNKQNLKQVKRYNIKPTRQENMKRENTKRGETKRDSKRERSQSPSSSRGRQQTTRKRSYDQIRERNIETKEVQNKRRKWVCKYCNKDHYDDQCQEYKTILERKAKLKDHCFNCLAKGHFSRSCKKRSKCFYCNKQEHHRSLCPKKFKMKTDTTLNAVNNNDFTLLQTAIVTVKDEKDHHKSIKCRLLLDSGSQRSYITRAISKELNLSALEENKLSIFGFASETPQEYDSNRVRLELMTRTNKTVTLDVNEVPTISRGIASLSIDIGEDKILADDGSLGDRVDILVGNDYYFDLISTEKIRLKDNLFLINSELGWIVSGKIPSTETDNTLSVITYCQNHDPNCVYFTEPDLPLKNMDITFLWALDSIGITDNPKATREEEAVKHFNETIKYHNGRYMIKWPWIEYPPDMPTNFGLSYGRLKGLIKRINEETLKEYQHILDEQLKNNIIEIIEPENDTYTQRVPPIHYLPHHMIKQEGKKGRIVYDASGKLKDKKSLNECMYRGPSMIGDLVALFIQFRTHKIAITADVEKAFLQIELQTEDRDVTRFLWIKDIHKPLSTDNIIHMRFCRVPFGIIASPFILTATLKYHVSQMDPELIPKIVDKCYVDNFVTGTNSTGEAIQLYKSTQRVFNGISMNMRDWISNDKTFLDTIPSEHKAKQTDKTKILGLVWNVEKDTLKLNIKEELFDENRIREPQNKRKILSTIASIYDPCGFCSPVILPIKLLLQELWELKVKWDTVLSEELQRKWEDLMDNLKDIKHIEIPRFMGVAGKVGNTTYELHGFSDASKYAYGTVIYLTAENGNRRNSAFVMAKSKVTPKEEREKLRMPRLELLGCFLGSKLMAYIKNVIGLPIQGEYLWTDSQIVLCWIHSNKLLPPFIGRRVNAIKENKRLELRYITSEMNPADLATRPNMWVKKKALWFNGPRFLKQSKDKWPNVPVFETTQPSLGQGPSDITNLMEIDEFIPDKTSQEENNTVNDTVKTVRNLQEEYFPLESKGKKTSLAINLDLFKDVDGLLRCNGRMKNADWSFDKRHPVLIPRDCKFSEDFVIKTHRENYHMGTNHTLSKVRELYWIPRGKSYVQRILKTCPECIKHKGGPFKLPPAPALPPERVNYTAPFTYTGVDYMGPFLVNNGNDKRWICLFTCLVVRAVHLEVVRDLTAEEGLLALRRMISTRGVPVLITSDNAQHFKLMADIISNQYCVDKKIRWRFINPLSPWAGGFYERLIGIVKNCMRISLLKHKLKDNQLSTVIKEIEAVINSRPLTSVDSEPDYILKPSDFLTVGRVITLKESEIDTEPQGTSTTKSELIKGWKRTLNLLREFKHMFSNRYLLSLRERYGHLPREPRITSKLSPSPGQIVQIKGDSKDRNDWKVGRITSLIPSVDGLTRAAKVQVGKSEYTRSIAHLYPLEIEDTPDPIMNIDTAKETRPVEVPIHNIDNIVREENSQQITADLPLMDTQEPEKTVPLETTEAHDVEPRSEEKEPSSSEKDNESLSLPKIIESNEIEGQRTRRAAATKAIEKIKEWTRDLSALLLLAEPPSLGSVAATASL